MRIRKIKKLLYRSFEEELNSKEKKIMAEALDRNPSLRKEKERIQELRRMTAESGKICFSPSFTERVMAEIQNISGAASPPKWENAYESMILWFRRLAVAGALAAAVLIVLILTMPDLSPEREIFYSTAVTYEEIQNLPLF
jgi:hypothetical protein